MLYNRRLDCISRHSSNKRAGSKYAWVWQPVYYEVVIGQTIVKVRNALGVAVVFVAEFRSVSNARQ